MKSSNTHKQRNADGDISTTPITGFYSPLPPCPDDPPAPPPPSCTPPKYYICADDRETVKSTPDGLKSGNVYELIQVTKHLEEGDQAREVVNDKSAGTVKTLTRKDYKALPPSASPIHSSPCKLSVSTVPPPPLIPPPPPSNSPPNDLSGLEVKSSCPHLDSSTSCEEVQDFKMRSPKQILIKRGTSDRVISDGVSHAKDTVALMRRDVSNREVTGLDVKVLEESIDKTRWYLGDIDDYTIIDKVGSGTYGEVFKCHHKITKEIVALKKLRPDVEKNGFPVTSIREMKILKHLKHPNIVAMREIVSSKVMPKEGRRPPLYFAFEYMEHDLSGLLNHPRIKFSRTQTQCYMRQLLCGIAFMHRNKIVHRDIKASNLLLNNQGMLKIGDFGLSRFWNEVTAKAGRYTNKVVTLWYRPPELLLGSTSYDCSVDVWSCGCIFAELLLGRPLLQGKTEIEQLNAIFSLCGSPTSENWPDYHKLPGFKNATFEDSCSSLRDRFHSFPQQTVDLLEKMLTLDPSRRISAMDALDHDYFWRVLTCKTRDLPKFCVSSTHEYQSKKRHQEEMAAATAHADPRGKDRACGSRNDNHLSHRSRTGPDYRTNAYMETAHQYPRIDRHPPHRDRGIEYSRFDRSRIRRSASRDGDRNHHRHSPLGDYNSHALSEHSQSTKRHRNEHPHHY